METTQEKQDIVSLQKQKNKFGAQSQNIPAIIRSFKIAVSKNIKNIDLNFYWQAGYHDHIRKYINNNTTKWLDDKYYIE